MGSAVGYLIPLRSTTPFKEKNFDIEELPLAQL
jgi:hypothetical protein